MFKNLKEKLKTWKLTKNMCDIIHLLKLRLTKNKRRKELQQKGIDIMAYVQNVLSKTGKTFFFDMGTLLGLVREGGILKHDLDIDATILGCSTEESANELRDLFLSEGCLHRYRITVDGIGIVEDTFIYNGIKFDICYYYEDGDKHLCYLGYKDPKVKYDDIAVVNSVVLACDKIEKTTTIKIGKYSLNIPEEPEKYLVQRYGESWRVPDKGYVYWKGPSATTIPNMARQESCLNESTVEEEFDD